MEQTKNENELEFSENRANTANQSLQTQPSEITLVNTNCSVCNSGLLNEIHALRPTHTLIELAEKIKNDYSVELSKDALSRHFQHYSKKLQTASARALWEKFNSDVESVANHQKKVLFLCNISFEHIMERLDSGTLQLGFEEFEKMVKLYYSVLRDPDSVGDENIVAIFQRASEKFGCGLEQGVLIKHKKTLD